ncbi:MAG: hypothetical protein DWI22_00215 [Planctomycetota bacterium]|nr:MAG: hypothetical protein DWI22_00215 [Planctomycetota bacterium]
MNLFPEIVRLSNHTLSHIHSFQGRSFLARCLMAAKTDPSGTPICPKCGETMVERVAGRGANRGGKFWGCPNYPDCRETAQ